MADSGITDEERKKPGMRFSLQQVRSLIEDHEKRFAAFHEKVGKRHQHFHNDPAVDPQLPPPFDSGPKFQSDEPRRVHRALKARLTENHFVVNVEPFKENASQKKLATKWEQFFNDGLTLAEERLGEKLQGLVADGQIISGFAVLHWTMARDIWPDVPEPEYLAPGDFRSDAHGEDYEALYRDEDEDEDAESVFPFKSDGDGGFVRDSEGSPYNRPISRYRETQASVDRRYKSRCAEAGFPWYVEVIDPRGFMFTDDRSMKPGHAIAVVRREVGLLSYLEEVEADEEAISLNQADKDIPVYGETDAPVLPRNAVRQAMGDQYPSEADWGETASVYQVWTRTEFYEVAVVRGVWALVKADTHPYTMPPFVLIPAETTASPDPALRYEPALEGIFRTKPFYDYYESLLLILGEQVALPYYYWRSTGNGAPMLNERGEMVTFTRDSAEAQLAPEGYELAKVDFEINPATVEAVQRMAETHKASAPPTGRAEVTTATQPWAIRLQQAQESVEPGALLTKQAMGIRTMARNMQYVHSLEPEDGGFDGPVYVFAVTKDGKVDRDTTEELGPKDVVSLDFGVSITGESAAERITKEQHGMQLIQGGMPITTRRWAEQYANVEDPEEMVADWEADRDYQQFVRPGIVQTVIRQEFGGMAVLGADGQFTGFGGQPLAPAQVLQMKGAMPPQPQGGPGSVGQPAPLQTQQPDMGTLQVPGTVPIGAGQP